MWREVENRASISPKFFAAILNASKKICFGHARSSPSSALETRVCDQFLTMATGLLRNSWSRRDCYQVSAAEFVKVEIHVTVKQDGNWQSGRQYECECCMQSLSVYLGEL